MALPHDIMHMLDECGIAFTIRPRIADYLACCRASRAALRPVRCISRQRVVSGGGAAHAHWRAGVNNHKVVLKLLAGQGARSLDDLKLLPRDVLQEMLLGVRGTIQEYAAAVGRRSRRAAFAAASSATGGQI